MKKFENVLVDLPGYGKTILPKKFTMNRGEGTITALTSHDPLLLAAKKAPSLTLPGIIKGANHETIFILWTGR